MTHKLLVVLFNGPPRSGKDTGAMAVYNDPSTTVCSKIFERFSMPLKIAYHGLFGEHNNVDVKGIGPYEKIKDVPSEELVDSDLGTKETYRGFQIKMSEYFMKEFYGENIFGRLAASRIRRVFDRICGDAICVIPDNGFAPEAVALREGLADATYILFRVHRIGTSYAGDSRGYIEDIPGYSEYEVLNDDRGEYEQTIRNIVKSHYVVMKQT